MGNVRVIGAKPGCGSDSTVTWNVSIAFVPSLTAADGPKTCKNAGLPSRSIRTRSLPAYEGRSFAVSDSGLPATFAPTSAVSRKGKILTATGFDAAPAASAWNGPGRDLLEAEAAVRLVAVAATNACREAG
jgi:hypothetical protein